MKMTEINKSTPSRVELGLLTRVSKAGELGIFFALVILVTIMSFASEYFLSPDNILNILLHISSIEIMAVGMTIVIVAGEIDLSVGAVLGLSAMVTARMMTMYELNPWLSVFLGLGFASLIGLINGLVIVKLKINSFVTTMGMMSIASGLTLLLADGGDNIPIKSDSVNFLGSGYIGIIPFPIILMIVVVILGQIFYTKTVWGKEVIAVGGNAKAANLSGIYVGKVKIMAFIISGFLAGFAGIIEAGIVNSATPVAGQGAELYVIAVAVIGGASLAGGKGSVIGSLIGALLIGVLRNSFVMLNFPQSFQIMSLGILIIAALLLDRLRSRTN